MLGNHLLYSDEDMSETETLHNFHSSLGDDFEFNSDRSG